jgi:uncharacterized membrane protein
MEDAYGFEAVSSLGDVAAGRSRPNEALRWTEASGFQLLGDLQTGPAEFRISEAYGISSGGTFVVGGARDDDGFDEVFRWDATHEMVGLGVPPTAFAAGADVSADGSVVVSPPGLAADEGNEAFLWDAQRGLRKLEDALDQEYGLDLNGWQLSVASAVSDDGRVIAGWGINPGGQREGYVLDLPEPASGPLALALVLALGALGASARAATPSGPRRDARGA